MTFHGGIRSNPTLIHPRLALAALHFRFVQSRNVEVKVQHNIHTVFTCQKVTTIFIQLCVERPSDVIFDIHYIQSVYMVVDSWQRDL